MKPRGVRFEFEEERNKELVLAYQREIQRSPQILLEEVLHRVVHTPCSRFWVSETQGYAMVRRMKKGQKKLNMLANKRAMYDEIYRRYCTLHNLYPHLSMYTIVAEVVTQPAPCFYLTIGSAKVILSKIKTKWYTRRRSLTSHHAIPAYE